MVTLRSNHRDPPLGCERGAGRGVPGARVGRVSRAVRPGQRARHMALFVCQVSY